MGLLWEVLEIQSVYLLHYTVNPSASECCCAKMSTSQLYPTIYNPSTNHSTCYPKCYIHNMHQDSKFQPKPSVCFCCKNFKKPILWVVLIPQDTKLKIFVHPTALPQVRQRRGNHAESHQGVPQDPWDNIHQPGDPRCVRRPQCQCSWGKHCKK